MHIFMSGYTRRNFDYPEDFFKEKIHNIRRPRPDDFQIKEAAENQKSKNPIIISGGGVFTSDAMEELSLLQLNTIYL